MKENEKPVTLKIATLGGGCFWCMEAVFSQLRGIKKIDSGYSGGSIMNPTYEQVSAGQTGHAEVVQLLYDSDVISYNEILKIFFVTHDPTTLNRQGADVGSQYRSVIFYHNEQQKKIAEQSKEKLDKSGIYKKPVATEITSAKEFYKAEEYHQQYFEKKGISSCPLF